MNIEKTISEHAVADILTPMLESQDRIVTEDVAPLFDAATGLDTPPASGTVTTTIEESRNLITAIIRSAWMATLTMLGGASVISYIAAAYTYLRTRLQGNETYGIPDRRSEISASSPLAANLALLNDRKIGGVPEAEDGISLVHLLCGSYADITELTDTNYGYTSSRNVSSLLSVFPALTKVTLGMAHRSDKSVLLSSNNITELNIPNLEEISGFQPIAIGVTGITKIAAPSLKNYDTRSDDNTNGICRNCPNVTEIDLRGLENVHHYSRNGGDANYAMIGNMQGLTKVQFGDIKTWGGSWTGYRNFIIDCPALIDLRFKSVSCSIDLAYWSPTLDSSNLQQFLQNFRDYIAERLAKYTGAASGKPLLTLSQAVFSAVIEGSSPICDEIKGFIADKNWKVQDTNNNYFPT